MKRCLDVILSIVALTVFGPVIIVVAILVWRQDSHWPFYSPW
ncbi:MAG: sugar transferase, partial [Kordiimonadaceae bacterium]|nr:sugar transferase [Kordiimonadaceae bacterium]